MTSAPGVARSTAPKSGSTRRRERPLRDLPEAGASHVGQRRPAPTLTRDDAALKNDGQGRSLRVESYGLSLDLLKASPRFNVESPRIWPAATFPLNELHTVLMLFGVQESSTLQIVEASCPMLVSSTSEASSPPPEATPVCTCSLGSPCTCQPETSKAAQNSTVFAIGRLSYGFQNEAAWIVQQQMGVSRDDVVRLS